MICRCPICGSEMDSFTNYYMCLKCGVVVLNFQPSSDTIVVNSNIPAACRNCSNHPVNGGSGVCHCILGSLPVIC